MAIKVTGTKEAKITVKGTDIELTDAYLRLRFLADFNGKNIEVVFATFQNKEKWIEGTEVVTNLSGGNFKSELEEGQEQSIKTAEVEAIKAFEQLGYKAEIV